jgi:hypothetical protein
MKENGGAYTIKWKARVNEDDHIAQVFSGSRVSSVKRGFTDRKYGGADDAGE